MEKEYRLKIDVGPFKAGSKFKNINDGDIELSNHYSQQDGNKIYIHMSNLYFYSGDIDLCIKQGIIEYIQPWATDNDIIQILDNAFLYHNPKLVHQMALPNYKMMLNKLVEDYKNKK